MTFRITWRVKYFVFMCMCKRICVHFSISLTDLLHINWTIERLTECKFILSPVFHINLNRLQFISANIPCVNTKSLKLILIEV